MDDSFSFLNTTFFTKASVSPGSLGAFRYRFQREGWVGDGTIHAWVYENICFELAEDAETADFPWTEEGVEALRQWLQEKVRERGAAPYRIPYPAPRRD